MPEAEPGSVDDAYMRVDRPGAIHLSVEAYATTVVSFEVHALFAE